MEVVNGNTAMLTNFEVYDFLKSEQSVQGTSKVCQDLATITYETKEYLSSTPGGHQSSDSVTKFMNELKKYNLTKAEKLQLINIRPTQAVEIQLIIEEMEERFDDEELDKLIELITEHLPSSNEDTNNNDNETLEQ